MCGMGLIIVNDRTMTSSCKPLCYVVSGGELSPWQSHQIVSFLMLRRKEITDPPINFFFYRLYVTINLPLKHFCDYYF